MKLFHTSMRGALLASTAILPLTAALAQEAEQDEQEPIEELVVTGSYIPDEKRATSEVSSLLDELDFTQTGDSDIAAALRRLPGLSLVGGKFVFVRGLGERYSSVVFDGSVVPSPEPLRRVVPLDIFPTSLLSGVLVQKTYSPQYSAEFGGGVIELRSKAIPDESYFEIGISGRYNSEATLKNGLSYDGSGTDFLGFDSGKRDLPDLLAADPLLENLNAAGREAAGEAFANVWSLDSEDNPVDVGLSTSFGSRFDVGSEGSIGFTASVSYSSQFQNRNGVRNTFTNSATGLQPRTQLNPEACEGFEGQTGCGLFTTEWTVDLNSIFSIGYEIDADNSLKYTTLLLRKSSREAQIQEGEFASDPGALRSNTRLDWVENQVWINNLIGEHFVTLFDEPTQIDWRASYSTADRDVDLRRETVYEFIDSLDQFFLVGFPFANLTTYGALDDTTYDFSLDITQPFTIGNIFGDIKFGGGYIDKDRDSERLVYSFDIPGNVPLELLGRVPEIIFGPANIGPGQIELIEFTDPSDTFTSGFENYQAYGQVDVQLLETVRLALGLRYEDSTQTAFTLTRGSITLLPDGTALTDENGQIVPRNTPLTVTQDAEYLLPAATLTWEFYENMQLRFGFSQTLSRPDLRELSFANFLDPERDTQIQGNPFLEITEIDNYDVRWEYYFGEADVATVGLFYKDFTNPIERTFDLIGNVPIRSYANALSAEVYGVEAEIEKYIPLGDWFDGEFFANRDFYIKANASYIESDITLDPDAVGSATNLNRDLQGQSRVIGNVQIGWDNYDTNETFAILFNYTGDRINDVGAFGLPDVVEDVPIFLDLTYSRDVEIFDTTFGINFKVQNILNDDFILRQGDQIFESYDLGTIVSFGITAKL